MRRQRSAGGASDDATPHDIEEAREPDERMPQMSVEAAEVPAMKRANRMRAPIASAPLSGLSGLSGSSGSSGPAPHSAVNQPSYGGQSMPLASSTLASLMHAQHNNSNSTIRRARRASDAAEPQMLNYSGTGSRAGPGISRVIKTAECSTPIGFRDPAALSSNPTQGSITTKHSSSVPKPLLQQQLEVPLSDQERDEALRNLTGPMRPFNPAQVRAKIAAKHNAKLENLSSTTSSTVPPAPTPVLDPNILTRKPSHSKEQIQAFMKQQIKLRHKKQVMEQVEEAKRKLEVQQRYGHFR
ncbi:hypothetical protein BC830DRAFT_1100017 [Chytriomyces sp. MP71]|nr:hypothetical protein BC830DRAFT_1100017 [Chytriomyces sp. MP71]